MPPPNTSLGLPDAPETIAMRAIVKILQSDPTLNSRIGRNWSIGTGTDADKLSATVATCPHIRVTAAPGPSQWETEDAHKAPMFVRIELHTAGTDSDQIMNLWHAVRSALFPPPTSDRLAWVRQTVQDAKIVKGILIQSGYGDVVQDDAPIMLYATGVLNLVLHVST